MTNKKTFYVREGRTYRPIKEYDPEFCDAIPHGTHLTICLPNGKITRYNVEPDFAPMIAAGAVAAEAISKALIKASELRHEIKRPLTEEQKAAWDHLIQLLGSEARYLASPSVWEAVQAGVDTMVQEAKKLMQDPAVLAAYEDFQLICALTKKHTQDQK
jgi:hypothetical protein